MKIDRREAMTADYVGLTVSWQALHGTDVPPMVPIWLLSYVIDSVYVILCV